jgi:hypothetical protein
MNNSQSIAFKNLKDIRIGLDIGGTLTKLTVIVKKEKHDPDFLNKYEFMEEIELDEHFLYIKLLQTIQFKIEVIECLKGISL